VPLPPLPIDPAIPGIVAHVRERRAAVVTAAPGAGKTTRVPPALVDDGPVILLQPRRMAARSIARRIAAEQGWTLGREVGWHVRFERRFTPETRLLVATEGILTARLQQDPLLSDFRTVVLDEFHERSIHADLALALAKQAWIARDDLRIVVMSATLEAGPVAAYLRECPIVTVPGETFPLAIAYRPELRLAEGAREAATRTAGQILCFLPGAPEIRRALPDVARALPGVDVVELHGSLDASAQDDAIAAVDHRRVILATNIAETSLTVPGVQAVVDSGLQKVARYDPDRAIDSLETERITRDAADQRAGRAARIGPGIAIRLWHEADRLRPHREPDIHRMDLSGPLLDVLAWGGDPLALDWFDPPRAEPMRAALALLGRLGAVDGSTLTPLGARMHRLPLHPRLARILIEGEGAWPLALGCALLSERHFIPAPPKRDSAEAGPHASTTSDLLSAVERERDLPPHVPQVARELQRTIGRGRERPTIDERAFRRAVLCGYPDRVARRRERGSPRVLLASGHGAVVAPESGVVDGEFLVALDVRAARRGDTAEARIRMASVVDKAWLIATASRIDHQLDAASGRVRAIAGEYYGAVALTERPAAPDTEAAAAILRDAYVARGPRDADARLLSRLAFAGLDVGFETLVARAAQGRTALEEIDLTASLTWEEKQALERLAPARLAVPSGRTHPLDYHADGSVSASVKLQELFGLAETPRIGRQQAPVLLLLLAPSGRPVQTTRDLRSFWETTYPEVRKELRGRYPKHPWPEDPWNAAPTARTKRRGP
jgi:ATP-dependent helicase HrpB